MGERGHPPIIETATTDRLSFFLSPAVLRSAPLKIAVNAANTPPPPRIDRMMVSLVASGNSTDAVRMTDRMTSPAITAPVNRFMTRALIQGPSTALSLHSSSRNTVALGRSTPARVCTALVRRPSGAPGVKTTPAATTIRPQ